MRVPGRTSSSCAAMTPTVALACDLGLVLLGFDFGAVVFCLLGRVTAEGACDGAEDVEIQASLVEVRRLKFESRNGKLYFTGSRRSR